MGKIGKNNEKQIKAISKPQNKPLLTSSYTTLLYLKAISRLTRDKLLNPAVNIYLPIHASNEGS